MKAIRVTKYKSMQHKGGNYYQEGNKLIQWYFYRRFDEALKLSSGVNNKMQIVGDLGCGWGIFLPTLSKSFRSAVALDSGEHWRDGKSNSLSIAKELVNAELGDVENVHYINGGVQRLPFNDNVFDVLFVMSVLEHVSDTKKAIDELHRVLVEGGALIVGAPNEVGMADKVREFASIVTRTERAASHEGYDWRNTEKELKKAFTIDEKIFVPFNLLRTSNPYVIMKCVKEKNEGIKIAQKKYLKICHICTKYPPAVSGIAKHVYDLSRLQAENGHTVTIYCPDDIGDISSVDIPDNVNVIQLKSLGRPLNNPITPSIIIQLLKNDFDIVHAHDFFLFGTMVAGFIKKIKKYSLIVTHHTNKLQYDSKIKNIFQDLYINIIGKKILKNAAKVIAVNEDMNAILQDLEIFHTEIILYGIHVEQYEIFDETIVSKLKYKFGINDEKIILFAGRLEPRKGVLNLISSFNIILSKSKDIKLLILGDGSQFKKAKEMTNRLGIEKNVVFVGNVSLKEMVHFYHLSDVFVMPSLYGETQGIVCLESLASGTPAIASNLPGIRTAISEDVGILVPVGDIKSLVDALEYLLNNDLILKKMKSNSKKRIFENYDWSIVYPKMEQLYQTIVKNKTN